MDAVFTPDTLDFLVENKLRDDRAWFRDNKQRYQRSVIAPFAALVNALTPAMLAIDGELLCTPKVDGSISRVWRDTRFAKDKTLFRDHMWCMFVRQKNAGYPEFFFVLDPGGFFYGCGYYAASAQSMACIRELILEKDEAFAAARRALDGQSAFHLDGEKYKRSRYPDAPEDLRDWLDRKGLAVVRRSEDFALLYSDEFADALERDYAALAPVYRFFMKAEQRVRRQA